MHLLDREALSPFIEEETVVQRSQACATSENKNPNLQIRNLYPQDHLSSPGLMFSCYQLYILDQILLAYSHESIELPHMTEEKPDVAHCILQERSVVSVVRVRECKSGLKFCSQLSPRLLWAGYSFQ